MPIVSPGAGVVECRRIMPTLTTTADADDHPAHLDIDPDRQAHRDWQADLADSDHRGADDDDRGRRIPPRRRPPGVVAAAGLGKPGQDHPTDQ